LAILSATTDPKNPPPTMRYFNPSKFIFFNL
jgi:hypothetical protein